MSTRFLRQQCLVLMLGVLAMAGSGCRTCPVFGGSGGGWRPIFDGSTRAGWSMVGPGDIALENHELVTHGGMGLLWYTPEKFGNCQIRVVFQLTGPKNNSGVFIRIPEPPNDPWFAVNRGYEVQIENNGDEYHRTGCLYSLTRAIQNVSAKVGDWNTMLITLDGTRTKVEVNGVLVTDYREGEAVPPRTKDHEPTRGLRPASGYIGLQNHDDTTSVRFREVSVRKL